MRNDGNKKKNGEIKFNLMKNEGKIQKSLI